MRRRSWDILQPSSVRHALSKSLNPIQNDARAKLEFVETHEDEHLMEGYDMLQYRVKCLVLCMPSQGRS